MSLEYDDKSFEHLQFWQLFSTEGSSLRGLVVTTFLRTNIQPVAEMWLKFLQKSELNAFSLIMDVLHPSNFVQTPKDEIFLKNKTNVNTMKHNLMKFFNYIITSDFIRRSSLIKHLTSHLTEMVFSKYVDVRIVAFLVGREIISSLLELEENLLSEEDDSESESGVKKQNRKKEYLNLQIDKLFTQIIARSLCDVESIIRVKPLLTIGNWIIVHPKRMATDYYLKYIIRLFYDKNSFVRLKAVKVAVEIVKDIKDRSIIHEFVIRAVDGLKPRVMDIDSEIGAEAIKALDVIDSNFEMLISDEDQVLIFKEIYSHSEIRALAAGRFLTRKFTTDKSGENFLMKIIDFQMSQNLDSDEYLISAIIQYTPYLTQWSYWITCLHNENDMEKKVLICSLLKHTVSVTATGQLVWSEDPKKHLSVQKKLKANQKSIKDYFIKKIVELIEEYAQYPKCLVHLISIPRYFVNISDSEIPVLMSLLSTFKEFILTSQDMKLVKECFHAFNYVAQKLNSEWANKAQNMFQPVLEQLNKCLLINISKYIQNNQMKVDSEDLKINLQRCNVCATFGISQNILKLDVDAFNTSIIKQDLAGIDIFGNLCLINISNVFSHFQIQLKQGCSVQKEVVDDLKTKVNYVLDGALFIIRSKLDRKSREMGFLMWYCLIKIFSIHNKKKVYGLFITPKHLHMEIVADYLQSSVPYSYGPGINPTCDQFNILKSYCYLLKNNVIPVSQIGNVVPYFQTDKFHCLLSGSLCKLLENPITMSSTVTVIICTLDVILKYSQKRERFTEEQTKNIITGLCACLHPKFSGLHEAILTIHIVGMEYAFLNNRMVLLNVLEFFTPLIRKKEHFTKVILVAEEYFGASSNDRAQAYIKQLKVWNNTLNISDNKESSSHFTEDEETNDEDVVVQFEESQ